MLPLHKTGALQLLQGGRDFFPALVKALDPNRSPPDEFQVIGRELYLHFPNGLGRSKLTNALMTSTWALDSAVSGA